MNLRTIIASSFAIAVIVLILTLGFKVKDVEVESKGVNDLIENWGSK